MAKLRFLLVYGCMMVIMGAAMAQNSEYLSGFTAKKLFLDYQALNGGEFGAFNRLDNGVELGYSRHLAERLNVYIPVKLGTINLHESDENIFILGADLQAQYYVLANSNVIKPYLLAGVGVVHEEGNQVEDIDPIQDKVNGENNVQFPIGLGMDVGFHKRGFFNVQLDYRPSLEEDRDNFNLALGWKYLFGPQEEEMPDEEEEEEEPELPDSDNDGIVDDLDLCPQTPGLAEFKGCPDTDGDGVMDPTDDCPDIAGVKALNGCPDSDGDGIADSKDECPSLFGTITNNGCPEEEEIENPDRDGDGINNYVDRCPDMAGPVENGGCPQKDEPEVDSDGDGIPDSRDLCPNLVGSASGQGCPDSDGDGVNDILDECPNIPGLRTLDGCPDNDGDGVANKFDDCPETYGPKSNKGCPEIKEEDKKVLDKAMRSVQFNTASDNLRSESYALLDQVADVLRSYPDYNLEISGHTDSQGDAAYNQRLSRNRARSCYEYLISRGVSSDNMTYVGYGETKPIATNDTPEGRALNRRTEFNLYPRSAR